LGLVCNTEGQRGPRKHGILVLTAQKVMIKSQDSLLLLWCNRRNSLDMLWEASLLLRVAIAKDYLGLDLLGLAREDDLTVIFTILATILQIFDEYRAIWGTVDFLTLANVLTDCQEGDLLVVRAVLRGKIHNLGGQLSLDSLNRFELVSMVQGNDDQTRVAGLLAQTDLANLS